MQVTIKAQKIVEICDKTIAELKKLEEQALKKSKELGRLYAEQYLVFEKEMNEYRDYIRNKDKLEKSSRFLRGEPPVVKARPNDKWLYLRNFKHTAYEQSVVLVESFKKKVQHAEDVILDEKDVETLFRIEHKVISEMKEYLQTTAQEDFDIVKGM